MIVTKWTSTKVKALRLAALRLTQEEFAEHVGYQPITVRKWERRPESRPVRGKPAQDLDTALKLLDDEEVQRFWAAVAETPNSGHPGDEADAATSWPGDALGIYAWEVDGDVRRREFGRLAAVTGAAVMLDSWEIGGDHLGMTDVRRLLDRVEELEFEDQRAGGAPLVSIAVEKLARAKSKLETCAFDTATGDAFAGATGELAVLAGWLAFDADMHPLARRCYSDAMALASQADNDDLTAHTCLYAANQSIALSQLGHASPHHALKLVDRARDLMRGRPPGRIHALIAIRQAQAAALLGDAKAFNRAIATAWREVDHAVELEPINECPNWLRFVNHAEVRGHEARGYGRIGEFAKAVDLLETAASEETSARNSVNTRAWLAAARAAAGDFGGALADALPVLTELDKTVSSPRTLRVLEPVRRTTDSVPAGAAFRKRFDVLAKTAVTV
ncbi:helix-turn-helix domain-containing protein [Nocardia sp. NBC_00565]|uniref:helix-turn-helix domain-containing protein n=1 Tax=Nocardia sp. NBC_00565 TaxID=2975993 RepID=UPI002E80BF30|nr:helix-turn-helix transcriptional regulator [Nocardia sp. NBC_00565]WUC01443.1 helix-turn-helix domain-containing protein [Nocardia sp. NBC_00565]